jgi:hypothetical protein
VCAIPGSLPRSTEGLPDDWFQGRVSFVDNLFIVDKSGGDAYPLYIFKESEGVFDIVGLSLSSTNDLVSFNNKQDWSLWLLNTNLIEGD